jgi:hypothetical protein
MLLLNMFVQYETARQKLSHSQGLKCYRTLLPVVYVQPTQARYDYMCNILGL